MPRFADYMRLVKFQHTIFAMPFALMAFAYAMWKYALAEVCPVPLWWCVPLVQVVLCMVFARNTAMGFNRWADRRIDAANPRTAGREIPAGVISPRRALTFVAVNALLFVACAATINRLTALLSPVALAVIMGYSYCKRFTWAAHLVLGLSLSIAPVGAYIALTGRFDWEPCVLALLVLTWCGGFDIIYALQDADYDRAHGLHSIPQRFSLRTALAISVALHAVSVGALLWFGSYCPQGALLWTGEALFVAILAAEHLLVTPSRQRNIGIAFGTLNGLASLTLALFVIAQLIAGFRQYEQPREESAAAAGPVLPPIRHVSRNESRAVAMASNSTRSSSSAGSASEASLALARRDHAASYPSTSNTTCSSLAISSSSMSTPSTEATSSALAAPRATRSM